MTQLSSTRIFYDASDDVVLSILHRVGNGLPRKEIVDLRYVDIPYDDFDPMTHDITHVENGVPIIVPIFSLTEEEVRIMELEDQLLLQLDNEIGGIV